jgi:lysozyme family protein
MLANLQTMRTNERQRIDRQRLEEARRRDMEPVAGPEALPGGAPAPMAGDMPVAAPAGTGSFATSAPVPDIQKAQYTTRNVTPAVAPNQSNAESARLSRAAPPAPRPGDPIVGGDWQPGTGQAVALRGPAGEKQRLDYLKNLNPATATGGNESPAEARRVTANPVPAATGTAPRAVDAQSAISRVLGREGGFVDDPSDRGGATNFGISSKSYPNIDVTKLTKEQAAGIYKRDYWDAINADSLPEGVREMAFDAAVNQGVPWTKQALAASGGDPAKFLQLRRDRYQSIVAADPTQGRFLQGWMNRLNEFGQTPQTNDTAPTAQAGAPTATTAQAPAAQAPAAAPSMSFTPEQVTQVAAATQQELRMTEMRLAEINRRLSYAPTAQEAAQLRAQANELRFGAFNAQLKNAAVQASTGNQEAVAQLANAAGVQYAQTPQGYVAVRLDPAKGQYVATTQPAPLDRFINTLYSEATGAAAKARADQNAAMNKVSGEIAVKRVEGENAVRKAQAEAQGAIQKAIAERRLTQADIKGMEFDPVSGKAYVRTNSGVFSVQPGQDLGDGMMSEPQLVPLRGLAG